MIPWLLTVGGALAAVVVVGMYRIGRRHRLVSIGSQLHGACFYLNRLLVTDLYLRGDHGPLEHDTVETSRNNTEGNVVARFRVIDAGSGRRTETAREIRYSGKVEPITMLPVVLEDLERDGKIIDVDLINGSLTPGAGLSWALETAYGRDAARRTTARLSDLRGYVWVLGVFHNADGNTVFSAPYGGSAGPPGGARVRITGVPEGLRPGHDVPQAQFRGRCFGRIQGWDSGELAIEPLAIIQQ